ncbi:ABC transporter ATP-binding protein [Laribacter hongkongensis]|uniref:Copper ABC transporter ATP-binding protein n=1 Tax=Laribacter hongkongensis TaxID=168471 RepID=A0A248LHX0_9NEIS|nr:ABC transporter ATP-binding protein [Laribacter hongkongensis]ASJ24347.1 copper ABC transporter ATP-binding protein [Laribacter hongkongensis]MCG9042047.1 ABC transporter ATP-binding protein [Laribacter hongkongensis]MCG9069227.1 ABC transporter ATP-binding protein [Laribacter hongkongensis]MCG9087890.1 ABC transporter ATP-binding protein [Laribacter hongkongensis]MCG9110971.1 ABC transporter ATP-binding protein [Laribacter hongkongensis]
MQNAIEVCEASRRFGEFIAVDRVGFAVAPGEVFGLIGHNGAGKSTLFKMMLGLLPASSGEIRLCGESVTGPHFRAVRRRIGYLPENVVLYDNLSGPETLAFFARLKGTDPAQCAGLLDTVGLGDVGHRHVRDYSKGMRQRLGFAQALLGEPKLLLLDEPTTGLDPEGIHAFYAVVEQVRALGTTVILTSHILAEIEQRVDRLALMSAGKLAALGTVAELSAAIDLPVTVELSLAPPARPAALATLEAAGFAGIEQVHGVSLAIARSDKPRLLVALACLSESLADVRFVEPTLEAVFLGHRRDTGVTRRGAL